MSTLEYQLSYHRNLPHIQPEGATLFITFRLHGSLPLHIIRQLLEEKQRAEKEIERIADPEERYHHAYLLDRRLFAKWDDALANNKHGPFWLRNPQIAALIADSIHYRHEKTYELNAFCIMPNHVHLVCKPLEKDDGTHYAMSRIMHSLKRHTARESNKLLNREGDFWQHENYDHVVRNDDEWRRIVNYVLNNPVKAGWVEKWEDWKWSYCRNL